MRLLTALLFAPLLILLAACEVPIVEGESTPRTIAPILTSEQAFDDQTFARPEPFLGDAAFVGDTMFMPDYGSARADFPGGDARQLYRSVRRLMNLPNETRVFLCHDYKAPNRDAFAWETTMLAERTANVHVHAGVSEDDFVAMRTQRDATLEMPRLILPSIQVNMRAGHLPEPEEDGTRYLKLPLNVL